MTCHPDPLYTRSAHRLGLARIAGRILVMDHGRIVQDSPHAEILSSPGLCTRMFRSQAAWYQREGMD